MNGWILLSAVFLILGLLLPLGILVQFALIGDKTRDEIHGDD